jgi:hypothetical protein
MNGLGSRPMTELAMYSFSGLERQIEQRVQHIGFFQLLLKLNDLCLQL